MFVIAVNEPNVDNQVGVERPRLFAQSIHCVMVVPHRRSHIELTDDVVCASVKQVVVTHGHTREMSRPCCTVMKLDTEHCVRTDRRGTRSQPL
jgi:hypothetical protein